MEVIQSIEEVPVDEEDDKEEDDHEQDKRNQRLVECGVPELATKQRQHVAVAEGGGKLYEVVSHALHHRQLATKPKITSKNSSAVQPRVVKVFLAILPSNCSG